MSQARYVPFSPALAASALFVIAGCGSSDGEQPDGSVDDSSVSPPGDGGIGADGADGGLSPPLGEAGTPLPIGSPCRGAVSSTGISVTDPSARWQREDFAGLGFEGYLDGPRLEMRSQDSPGLMFFEGGGDYVLRAYDRKTDRYVTLAGGARGYLDGPFSRARFGGWGYAGGLAAACGPDGSLYVMETGLHVVRRVDFTKQEVSTVISDPSKLGMDFLNSIVISSAGKMYLFGAITKTGYGVTVTDLDGKLLSQIAPLAGQEPEHGYSMAMDEKHNRLYAANRCKGDWFVWYWDLSAGGAFTGVLPMPKPGDPARASNVPGPFKGANPWCPGGIGFGPDDPDYRYLYYGGGDYGSFWRLDLQAEMMDTFGPVNPADNGDLSGGLMGIGHSSAPVPFYTIGTWGAFPEWGDQNNDMYISLPIYPRLSHYRRVQ